MELWLDTIDLNTIKDANEIGILTGVTTNPITLSHADMLPEAKLAQLLNIQNGYVAAQVVANSLNDIPFANEDAKFFEKVSAIN